jgi:hypothetical protein
MVLGAEGNIKMSTPKSVDPSDAFHASTGSHGAVPAGKNGNTHVVPPKCEIAKFCI